MENSKYKNLEITPNSVRDLSSGRNSFVSQGNYLFGVLKNTNMTASTLSLRAYGYGDSTAATFGQD